MIKALLIILPLSLFAQNNVTESNSSAINKNIQKAIEKEKKYKKEQKFYQGKDYNLSEQQIDPKSVDKVPLIEPEYDFDITDLYSDWYFCYNCP